MKDFKFKFTFGYFLAKYLSRFVKESEERGHK